MTTFVLVPGMWLGAWAWRDVTARLRADGHTVHPLTLTGLADRAHLTGADLETHVQDVVNLIRAEELHDVVLVAHSYACVPVRVTADRIPQRLARVAYVECGPLPDGMSQADVGPPRDVRDDAILPPDWFADDDPRLLDLTGEQRAELTRRATPHPLASATGRISVQRAEQPPTDLVISLMPGKEVQRLIDEQHPFFAGLDRRDYRVHELPTGHWPMFTRPAELAEILGSLGR